MEANHHLETEVEAVLETEVKANNNRNHNHKQVEEATLEAGGAREAEVVGKEIRVEIA